MGRNYFSYGIWDLPAWIIVGFVSSLCLIGGLSYLVYSQEKTIRELNEKVIHYEGCRDVMNAVKEIESWKKRLHDNSFDEERWLREELRHDRDRKPR